MCAVVFGLNFEQKVIVLHHVATFMHEMLPAMRTLKGHASLVPKQSQNNHLVVLLLSLAKQLVLHFPTEVATSLPWYHRSTHLAFAQILKQICFGS